MYFKIKKGQKLTLLDKLNFRRKYGILYLEYKYKYCYWEIILMFLKVIIIILDAVFNYDLIMVNNLLISVFIFLYFFILLKILPYRTKGLN